MGVIETSYARLVFYVTVVLEVYYGSLVLVLLFQGLLVLAIRQPAGWMTIPQPLITGGFSFCYDGKMQLSFDMGRFSIGEPDKHEYEHYVKLTSELIERSYFVTHKLVETWPMEKIKRHYTLATKHHGSCPQDKYWWHLRKKEKEL